MTFIESLGEGGGGVQSRLLEPSRDPEFDIFVPDLLSSGGEKGYNVSSYFAFRIPAVV